MARTEASLAGTSQLYNPRTKSWSEPLIKKFDLFYPQVGVSMARILEQLGHKVDYPANLTCCGQPPFNSGYGDESRAVAEKCLDCLDEAEVVVSASGSCGAMLKVFYPELFHDKPQESKARALSTKVYEFSDFPVNQLGVIDVGASCGKPPL